MRFKCILLCLLVCLEVPCQEKQDLDSLIVIEIEDDIKCKKDSTFTLIHFSDAHGGLVSVSVAMEYTLGQECDFVALTGDILPDFKFIEALSRFDCPVFVIPGNYDVWHRDGLGQHGFRNYFGYRFSDNSDNVHWANSLSNYWYFDIRKRNHFLRVIDFDQFELDAIDNPKGVQTFITREQVNWLINVLKNSDSCDGVVVSVHMGLGNKSKGAIESNFGKFVSELADKNVKFEIVDDIDEMASFVDVLISCITSADGLLVDNVDTFKKGITMIPVHTRGFRNCDCIFDSVFGDDTDYVRGFKFFLSSMILMKEEKSF